MMNKVYIPFLLGFLMLASVSIAQVTQSEDTVFPLEILISDMRGNEVLDRLPEDVKITVDVTDEAEFVNPIVIQYYLDETLIDGFTAEKLPYSFTRNLSGIVSGAHNITIVALDQSGKKARGSTIALVGIY